MSNKNKRLIKKIIKVFSENNCINFIRYFDDNIKWNIVGMPVIKGKNEFIKAVCSLELENFSSSNIRNIISEGELVVVESVTKQKIESNTNEKPAYCDIYRIKNNIIYELTTYIVDTSVCNDKYDLLN